jgi:ubiquinone/menaquinone biosynthesis C-methylase UbiE
VSEEVRAQFSRVAANYRTSHFHADPAGLEEVLVLCQPRPSDFALDVATGTGHTAFALAGFVEQAIGLDITPAMLEQARRAAEERRAPNIAWVLGDACCLPFPARTFDLYTVRAAPHHFHDLEAALAEAVRVLKRGGRACFIDCSPPPAARDFLHQVEVARDPSHVRCLTVSEWSQLLEDTGLEVEVAERRELDWNFQEWMDVMELPPEQVSQLATVIESARGEARDQLQPTREEGALHHRYWHALIRARKPR